MQGALLGTSYQQPALPRGIGYTLAVRRATRVGPSDGAAIEDVGVRGDFQYAMTKDDLVGDNSDLIAFAGRLVLGQPRTALTVSDPDDAGRLVIRTRGVDQVDVVVDGLFQPSRPVTGQVTRVTLAGELDRARGAGQPVRSARPASAAGQVLSWLTSAASAADSGGGVSSKAHSGR